MAGCVNALRCLVFAFNLLFWVSPFRDSRPKITVAGDFGGNSTLFIVFPKRAHPFSSFAFFSLAPRRKHAGLLAHSASEMKTCSYFRNKERVRRMHMKPDRVLDFLENSVQKEMWSIPLSERESGREREKCLASNCCIEIDRQIAG